MLTGFHVLAWCADTMCCAHRAQGFQRESTAAQDGDANQNEPRQHATSTLRGMQGQERESRLTAKPPVCSQSQQWRSLTVSRLQPCFPRGDKRCALIAPLVCHLPQDPSARTPVGERGWLGNEGHKTGTWGVSLIEMPSNQEKEPVLKQRVVSNERI